MEDLATGRMSVAQIAQRIRHAAKTSRAGRDPRRGAGEAAAPGGVRRHPAPDEDTATPRPTERYRKAVKIAQRWIKNYVDLDYRSLGSYTRADLERIAPGRTPCREAFALISLSPRGRGQGEGGPEIRHPWGLGQRFPLVRRMARLARRTRSRRRPGARPGRACPRDVASLGRGDGARRALLREGPRADPHRDPGDGGAPARRRPIGHGRPRGEHRAGLAAPGPASRSPRSGTPAREPSPACVSGRRRYCGASRASDTGSRYAPPPVPRRGPRDALPTASR